MKALTITQPAATLVALGVKTIEPCPWFTTYRGPIAIHAAEVYPQWAKDRAKQEPFRTLLRNAGFSHWIDLPTGAIIAIGNLDDCQLIAAPPDDVEAALSNCVPGQYAWRFSHMRQLPTPILARDSVGLWDWHVPPEVEELLSADAIGSHNELEYRIASFLQARRVRTGVEN